MWPSHAKSQRAEMHSPDDEAADSAGPFGGKPPPLFGGERSRRTKSITRLCGFA